MAEKKKVQDPSEQFEIALNAVLEDKPEIVTLRKKSIKVGDMKKGTIRFITDLKLSTEDSGDPKTTAKIAAAIVVNSWWGLKAFFGISWRLRWMWYYYIKQYSDRELLQIINIGKKKADMATAAYSLNIILATAMKDTSMTKTREEAKRIQAENVLEQLGQQQKNSPTSQPADISSDSSK